MTGRKRRTGLLERMLEWIWPQSGDHHAIPGDPPQDPPPAAPRDAYSPGSVTLSDIPAFRVPGHMRQGAGDAR